MARSHRWGGQRLRRLISECHKRDLKLIVYVGYGARPQCARTERPP